jgi:IS605 OrfB family transposase
MLLTMEIKANKKSVINKLERTSKTFQQFKNLLYLCTLEYYQNTKDIKPFLKKTFLEKFVKGKVDLPYENEKIKKWEKELVELWTKEIASDTAKALVGMVAKEYKSILGKWKGKLKSELPKPKKLNSLYTFTLKTNPNMVVDKVSAKLQSEGKELEHKKLWKYRRKRLNQIFGMVSNFIVSLCLKEGIGRIIVSDSLTDEYQKESSKGKKFNQAFRQIPLGRLIQKLQYKCQLAGIELLIEPEPFTSQLSFITGNIEEISGKDRKEITQEDVKKLQFTGKRLKRGLFKDYKLNKVFNADLNGALNIAIKKLGKRAKENFLSLANWLDKLSRSVRLTLFSHLKYSVSPLFERITDSSSYLLN